MRSFALLGALLLALVLSSCYHMRAEPVQILPRIIKVRSTLSDPMIKIRQLVEDEWRHRILDEDSAGKTLITTPYHFATDTGPGQPAGGRKYYTQLKIEVLQADGQVQVTVTPYNYEIRTSYAYNLDAQVRTLYKHYPYEQYPGMFDIAPLNIELDRVAAMIKLRLL